MSSGLLPPKLVVTSLIWWSDASLRFISPKYFIDKGLDPGFFKEFFSLWVMLKVLSVKESCCLLRMPSLPSHIFDSYITPNRGRNLNIALSFQGTNRCRVVFIPHNYIRRYLHGTSLSQVHTETCLLFTY